MAGWDTGRVRRDLTGDARFRPDGLFFACEASTGRPVATATAWWSPRFGRLRPTLHMVAGLPDTRGRGLGKLVCQAAVAYMARQGATEVILTTDDHRLAAIAIYLGLGFLPMRYHGGEDHEGRWQAVLEKLPAFPSRPSFAGPGRPVAIGVVGLRRGLHISGELANHPAAAFRSCCDSLPERAEGFRRQFPQAQAAGSYEALLDGPAEAVIVATDMPTHVPLSVAAMRAGKDVLSEVTAFYTPAQGVELVETVEQSGRRYMLAENCLYTHAMMELMHQTMGGGLGELRYAEGDYVHDIRYLTGPKNPPQLADQAAAAVVLHARAGADPALFGPAAGARHRHAHRQQLCRARAAGWTWAACSSSATTGAAVRILSAFAVQRHPSSLWVCYYGREGSLETDRLDERIHLWRQGNNYADGPLSYRPTGRDGRPMTMGGHFGADGRMMQYWIESLANGLASPINVYEGADMTLPGLLGHRSSLRGNVPMDIPDFRDPAQREHWRNDTTEP